MFFKKKQKTLKRVSLVVVTVRTGKNPTRGRGSSLKLKALGVALCDDAQEDVLQGLSLATAVRLKITTITAQQNFWGEKKESVVYQIEKREINKYVSDK